MPGDSVHEPEQVQQVPVSVLFYSTGCRFISLLQSKFAVHIKFLYSYFTALYVGLPQLSISELSPEYIKSTV